MARILSIIRFIAFLALLFFLITFLNVHKTNCSACSFKADNGNIDTGKLMDRYSKQCFSYISENIGGDLKGGLLLSNE